MTFLLDTLASKTATIRMMMCILIPILAITFQEFILYFYTHHCNVKLYVQIVMQMPYFPSVTPVLNFNDVTFSVEFDSLQLFLKLNCHDLLS